jgi:hypothetical protein
MKLRSTLRRLLQPAALWAAVGSIVGIAIGIVLVALHGFSIVSLSFWFSVGILIGAVAGFLSFFLYSLGYWLFKKTEPPVLFRTHRQQ